MRRVLYLVLLAYSLEGVSMSLLTRPEEEVVLCSPMEGRITFEGKPAVGAKIQRFIKWKDQVGEYDTVFTNDKGKFFLPEIKKKVKLNKIATFAVAQEVRVLYMGIEYPIWVKSKREKGIYGELGGQPVNFRCELTDDLVPIELGDEAVGGSGLLASSCKWDSILKGGK